MPPDVKGDPAFCQRLAALYWHCAGRPDDNCGGYERSRSWAAHFYAKARVLMGVGSDDWGCNG